MKNKKKSFPIIEILILLLFVISIGSVFMIVEFGKKKFPLNESMNLEEEGFTMYDDISGSSATLENDKYKFELSYSDTSFKLTDKTNGNVYLSNPGGNAKDTLVVYYSLGLGTPTMYGNYDYSIYYKDTHRYALKVDGEKIEVLYLLGGKFKTDYTDFPQVISIDRLDAYFAIAQEYLDSIKDTDKTLYKKCNTDFDRVKNSYSKYLEHNYYVLGNASSLNKRYIESLDNFFYNMVGYTKEDLERDNLENDVEVVKNYPTFEIPIAYELTDAGLSISIDNDNIVDTEEYPLIYIDVLPYFGCAGKEDSGYSMIPDGSGMLIDFNNNRQYANTYEKRIYGEELSKNSELMDLNISNITMNMFGMKINDSGFINIIEDGASESSINASINSVYSSNNYNQTFYRYYYRETDTYKFESVYNANDIQTWTNSHKDSDIKLLIIPLQDDFTYNGMAKTYQKYLIDKGILSQKDNTSSPTLDLTLIGGYVEKKNFLGISYEKTQSLTDFDGIKMLAQKLSENGVDLANIYYEGFTNSGIKGTYIAKPKFENRIISKKDLNSLNTYINNIGYKFIPSFNVLSAYSKKNISLKNIAKDQYGERVVKYSNNVAEYVQDKTTKPLYYLKPKMIEKSDEGINKILKAIGSTNVKYRDISNLYGSYQNNETIFREVVEDILTNYLESLNKNVSISNPCMFALKYANNICDLEIKSTDYAISIAQVPFVEMVYSGYLDYSFESINLIDGYSPSYIKMKLIEYLSNVSMTWTSEETTQLIDTEFNYIHSTYYENYFDNCISLLNELKNLNIYSSKIQSHEFISGYNIVKVTYENGVEIVFNYSNENYLYGSLPIEAMNYKVVKEAN